MPYFKKTYNHGIPWDTDTLVYQLCPKNACTSVAHMLIQADGNGYINDTHKDYETIHALSKPTSTREAWTHCQADVIFAIKRDPVERFVSAYRNRILYHNDLAKKDYFRKVIFRKKAIDPENIYIRTNKDINEFIENFDMYWNNLWVQGHFKSQTVFMGHPKYYTHIFDMSELDEARKLISKVSGKDIVLPYLQTGGNDAKIDLSKDNIKWIKNRYKDDYENGWC